MRKAHPTRDIWSGELERTLPDGCLLNYKPYAAYTMYAVFKWDGSTCVTLYDGSSEAQAKEVFYAYS